MPKACPYRLKTGVQENSNIRMVKTECKQTCNNSYTLKKLDAYTGQFLKNKVRRSQIFNISRAKIINYITTCYDNFNKSVQ